MLDNFHEQLVAQKLSPTARSTRMMILIGSIFGSLVLCWLLLSFPQLALPFGLGAFVIMFFGWRAYNNFYVEFEYIFTNGELDIDKITAKRKRTRVISLKLSEVGSRAGGKSFFCGRWYDGRNSKKLHFLSAKHGSVELFFDPDEKLTELITPYLKGKTL